MTIPRAPEKSLPLEEKFSLTSSRHFTDRLARMGASIAFTTYQAGKVFFVGLKSEGRLAVFERSFARCMGLGVAADARSLVLATQYQLLRFDNVVHTRTLYPCQLPQNKISGAIGKRVL